MPIADGAHACPFVAFADDRDERATTPDHRHRCYAEVRPSPRALAHQEAYCLSSAFPVCPTLQDWARRESARARAETARTAATAASAAAAATPAAGDGDEGLGPEAPSEDAGVAARDVGAPPEPSSPRDGDDEEDEDQEGGPRRNPPRDWSAPPPWLASAEAGSHDRPLDSVAPEFLAGRSSEPGQGLAGSPADRLAGGPTVSRSSAPPPIMPPDEPAARPDKGRAGPAGANTAPSRRPRAYDQHLGGPDWERPKRYEAYPTIQTRIGMPAIPRIVVMAAAIGIAALALFFLPALLGVGRDAALSPSPSASTSASGSVSPSATPAATPILYTIKKGDLLSRIAKANGVTLDQLMKANPSIKDPNKIIIGQQITIPTPEPSVPNDFGGSPSPSKSP